MMIFGQRQSGNDIDVHLSPLIKDLKLLWDQDVEVFDKFANGTFKMHAMLFCTINEPTYGNLLGYNVNNHKTCPICEEDTASQQLKHGRNTIYLRHWKFLRSQHPYWRLKNSLLDIKRMTVHQLHYLVLRFMKR